MLKQFLKPLVPERLKETVRRQVGRTRYWGLARRCPVCWSQVRTFLPHGVPAEEQAVCPVCGSKAPHRLAAVYFRQHPELFVSGEKLLHIAPERELGRKLEYWAHQAKMSYFSGGITGSGKHYLDIHRIDATDNTYQLIYCCHVLNMVEDDRLAMRQCLRVLKPGGVALLQVPAFHPEKTTLEPATVAERVAAYNDPMIFRVYSNQDYVTRLTQAGFTVTEFRAADVAPDLRHRSALKSEVLHVCRKPM